MSGAEAPNPQSVAAQPEGAERRWVDPRDLSTERDEEWWVPVVPEALLHKERARAEQLKAERDGARRESKEHLEGALAEHTERAKLSQQLKRLEMACREVDASATQLSNDKNDSERVTHYELPCGPWHRVLALTGTGAVGKSEGESWRDRAEAAEQRCKTLERAQGWEIVCDDCGVERADYEGPGKHLPQCPSCASDNPPVAVALDTTQAEQNQAAFLARHEERMQAVDEALDRQEGK